MRRLDIIAHHEHHFWTYAIPELGTLGAVAQRHEVRADARVLIAFCLNVPIRTVPLPTRIRYVERPFDEFTSAPTIFERPNKRRLDRPQARRRY